MHVTALGGSNDACHGIMEKKHAICAQQCVVDYSDMLFALLDVMWYTLTVCADLVSAERLQSVVICVCAPVCVCIFTHKHIKVYVYVCMHICMYVCMYVFMYVRKYAYMYVCMYACMCVCVYVCIQIHTHTHTQYANAFRIQRTQRQHNYTHDIILYAQT